MPGHDVWCPVKALTIRQPWATLIALGVKTIETRSWRTNYRGPLAIHAGLRVGGRHFEQFGEWSLHVSPYVDEPQLRRLGAVARDGNTLVAEHIRPLPLGAVVATCTLADCVPMVDHYEPGQACLKLRNDNDTLWLIKAGEHPADAVNVTDQLPYGDFRPGRWAWLLEDITPCDPVPAKGKQGLWEWQP